MYWIIPLICLPFVAMRPTGKWRLIIGFIFSFCFLFALILCTYRNQVGTDWDNYYRTFASIGTLPLFQAGYEPLYELVIRLASNYNFSLLLAFNFLLICIPTYSAIWKFSPYPLLSLFLLYSYSLNSFGFGYRQDIAISLFFFAFLVLFGKLSLYYFTLILATLVHWSAIVVFFINPLVWFLKACKDPGFLSSLIKLKKILLFATFISLLVVLYSLFPQMAKYSKFLDDGVLYRNDLYALVGLLTRLVNTIIVSLVVLSLQRSKLTPSQTFFADVLERCSSALWIGFVIYLFSLPLGEVVQRLSRYFDIFSIVAVPLSISFIRTSYVRSCLFIFFVLIASLRIFIFFSILAPVEFVPYSSYLF